jgi:hypothetical protein
LNGAFFYALKLTENAGYVPVENAGVENVRAGSTDHRVGKRIGSGDLHSVSLKRAYFHTAPGHDYINPKKHLVMGDYCRFF